VGKTSRFCSLFESKVGKCLAGSGYLPLFMLYLSPLVVNSYLINTLCE